MGSRRRCPCRAYPPRTAVGVRSAHGIHGSRYSRIGIWSDGENAGRTIVVRAGQRRKASMAKRHSKRRDASTASVSTRTATRHDPIRVGRAPVGKVRVLDKPLVGLSRAVQSRPPTVLGWQSRVAAFNQEVSEARIAQAAKTRAFHDAARLQAIAPIKNNQRPNRISVASYGALTLPDASRIGKSRNAKTSKNILGGVIISPKEKGGVKGGESPPLWGSLGARPLPPRAARPTTSTKPDRSPDKVRAGPTCKERPTFNRGDGSSRRFVPWCKIKR